MRLVAAALMVAAFPALAQVTPTQPQAPAPAPAPAPAVPPAAPVQPPQAGPGGAAKPSVANLLTALRAAPTEQAAAALEAQLRAAWVQAASPAIRLLLSRGQRELMEGAPADSMQSYDDALEMDPGLTEAWRGRAVARLHSGDTAGAVQDLQEVIKREPRDFAAWQDLSRIAESRGDWRGAYAAWQRVLEVDPKTPGGQERLKDLRRRAVGEDA